MLSYNKDTKVNTESVSEAIDKMRGTHADEYLSAIKNFQKSKESVVEQWVFGSHPEGCLNNPRLRQNTDLIKYVRDRYSQTPNEYAKRKYAIFLMLLEISETESIALCEDLVALFRDAYDSFNFWDFHDLRIIFKAAKTTGNRTLIDKYIELVTCIIEDSDFGKIYNNLIPLTIENLNLFGSEWLMNYSILPNNLE